MEALLAAFEDPTPVGLSLTYAALPEDQPFVEIDVQLKAGGGWGFSVDLSAPLAELLVSLAYGIQEHLPEQSETWAQPRPRCHGHRHEAVARLIKGAAWWVCPQTETLLGLIAPIA